FSILSRMCSAASAASIVRRLFHSSWCRLHFYRLLASRDRASHAPRRHRRRILGAYHGLNPGMGWLFAVVLSVQERRRSAILRAPPAIAVGYEASIGVVALLVAVEQSVAGAEIMRPVAAIALTMFGGIGSPRFAPTPTSTAVATTRSTMGTGSGDVQPSR